MRKFITKLFIYATLLSSITLGINLLHICLIDNRNLGTMGILRDNDGIVKNVPDNIQICNFGSSHAYYGFNYEDAMKKYTCFSFAMASQSLRYDCKILEHYRDKLQKGAAVFITISYFSFFGKPEVQEEGFAAKNKRYYKCLPPEMIDQYDSTTAFYVKYLPAFGYNNPFSLLKALVTRSEDGWKRETTPEESDGLARYKYHVANRFDEHGRRILKQEAIDALYRMIDICREIGAVPIMITTPYLHEYVDAARDNDPQFFTDFHAILDEVMNSTGVKYYDYSEDERFRNDYSLFFNSDHLNRKGAKLFTNTLLREVLSIDVH